MDSRPSAAASRSSAVWAAPSARRLDIRKAAIAGDACGDHRCRECSGAHPPLHLGMSLCPFVRVLTSAVKETARTGRSPCWPRQAPAPVPAACGCRPSSAIPPAPLVLLGNLPDVSAACYRSIVARPEVNLRQTRERARKICSIADWPFHLGNLRTALVAWLMARRGRGVHREDGRPRSGESSPATNRTSSPRCAASASIGMAGGASVRTVRGLSGGDRSAEREAWCTSVTARDERFASQRRHLMARIRTADIRARVAIRS